MRRILRGEEDSVAAAVATMLMLVVVLVLLELVVVAVVPSQMYTAEWTTSKHDLQEFDSLRSMVVGPTVVGSQFTVPIQLGTGAVSPFATASQGTLEYLQSDPAGLSLSFRFVPQFRQASVQKTNQDVVLVMDDSGSMAWNDPSNLRIQGAQDYVSQLTPPDCVAIVAFNGRSYLTQANVGGTPHHFYYPGMCGNPNYNQPIQDLGTISDIDSTNIGLAIATANNELIANGHPGKAWVEILLTDGQNECGGSQPPCGDAYTLQMAGVAKTHNITIYTIGLSSSADASLLTQIASMTGGTYYAAPTAASIKWIYFEIALHYTSSVRCGNVFDTEAYGGALSLTLNNAQYPAQTLRMESGGIAIVQSDSAGMYEGLPMSYTPNGDGSGSLSLSLVTLTGSTFQATGTDTHFVQAQVLGHSVVDQSVLRVRLDQEAAAVGNISSTVTYWTNQGAATPSAGAAVVQPLNAAQTNLQTANANSSMGNVVGARFDVDRAQGQLAIALNTTESQRKAGTMQNWLAKQTEDSILFEECRIGQWANWYDGLTITITTSVPFAWTSWLNETLTSWKLPFSLGASTNTVVVSLHALDRIVTDQRVVSLSCT